jgi:pyroglutamyl-peptidase I
MKRILITGFMPFAGATLNPAWEAVKNVTAPEGVELIRKEISVVFGQAIDELLQAVEELRPDAVICVGLAQGRPAITPERVAINVNDARIPDNSGACPVDEPIRADGPAAYFTKLPIKAIVEAVNAAGIKAQVSNTAGTYVCNNIMYGLLYAIDHQYPGMIGGFIHVPASTDMAAEVPEGTPMFETADIAKGLTIAVEETAKVC